MNVCDFNIVHSSNCSGTEHTDEMSCSKLGTPHIPVTLFEHDDLQSGALKILKVIRPDWKEEGIKFKV